jgi:hypothetical protein
MKPFEKHGMTDTPEYKTWSGIIKRCEQTSHASYDRYGGRGIKMCPEWRNSFMKFFEDMGPKPGPEYSIDRINNDGDYEPSNCRWATKEEQDYNRSTTIDVTIPSTGNVLNSKQASEHLNMNQNTLYTRLFRGKDIEHPVVPHRAFRMYKGEMKTLDELSAISGIDKKLIKSRISNGMTVEEAVDKPYHEIPKYSYKGEMLTVADICDREHIAPYNLRYHLRGGLTVEEAIRHIKKFYMQVTNPETGEIEEISNDLYLKHGDGDSYTYRLWANLKAKYYNKNNPEYQYQGAKGLRMCDRWIHSYPAFKSELIERPSANHVLRHIDPKLPLGPDNHQWIDKSNLDRPKEAFIPMPDGRMVTIDIAMKETGLKRKTIYERVRTGVPLSLKPRGIFNYQGREWTIEELSAINGVPIKKLRKRIYRGMPIEKAILKDL